MPEQVHYDTTQHPDRWISRCRWCGLRIVCLVSEGIRRLRLLQGEHAAQHTRQHR